MRRWSSTLLLLLILFVTAHAATAQVQVVSAYVYGLSGTRVATFPTGNQVVGTAFAVQGLPANSTWKLSYYAPGGSLAATASGAYNNPAPPAGTAVTLARAVPRLLSLTKGDWHIQLAINGQPAKDIYFAAGLGAPMLDHALVIGQDFFTEQTQFGVGNNLIGSTAWLKNIPAGTWVRLRYQRPDGTIAADNTWDPQGSVSYDGFIGARWFVNLNQTGTWHLIYDLSGQTLVTKEFYVGNFVTQVNLGLPQFVSDSHGRRYLSLRVYLKGHGTANVSGQWLLDGHNQAYVPPKSVDLSSGGWKEGAELQLDSELSGNHTFQFQLYTPTVLSTQVMNGAFTGFKPDVNGWSFANDYLNYSIALPTATWQYILQNGFGAYFNQFSTFKGLCSGMVNVARDSYIQNNNLPSNGRTIDRLIRASHDDSNAWYSQHDFPRIISAIVPVGPHPPTLSSETDRVMKRLQHIDPCVIALRPVSTEPEGHAVLGVVGFSSLDIYDANKNQLLTQMRLFAIYDPNFPGVYKYVGTFDFNNLSGFGSVTELRFLGYSDSELANNPFYNTVIMLNEYTYHTGN